MNPKTMLFIAIGFGLYFVSRSLELRGDAAPLETNGPSLERLQYHGVALVCLLGALVFFVTAAVTALRRRRG